MQNYSIHTKMRNEITNCSCDWLSFFAIFLKIQENKIRQRIINKYKHNNTIQYKYLPNNNTKEQKKQVINKRQSTP